MVILVSACGPSNEERRVAALQFEADGDLPAAVFELKALLQSLPNDREARAELARLSLESGDFETAAVEFQRAIDLGSQNRAVFRGFLRSQLYLGDAQSARRAIDDAGRQDWDAEDQLLFGEVFAASGDFSAADRFFRQAGESPSVRADAYVGLAINAVAAGQMGEARAAVTEALKADSRSVSARLLQARLATASGDAETARKAFQQAAAGEDSSTPIVLRFNRMLAEASFHLGQSDLASANRAIADLEQAFPGAAVLYLLKGQARLLEDDVAGAKDLLQRYVQSVPEDSDAQIFLGAVNLQQENFRQAEMFLSRSVDGASNPQFARRLLAQTQLRLDKPDEAFAALRLLESDGQSDVGVLAMLGQASIQKGENDAGLDFFERGLELEPDNSALRLSAAAGYMAAGQPERAIELLSNDGSNDADLSKDSLLLLALIATGDLEGARRNIDTLVRNRPDSSETQAVGGSAYMMMGDSATATSMLQRALELDPKNAGAKLSLARVYLASNQPRSAEPLLTSLMSETPDAVAPVQEYFSLLLNSGRQGEIAAFLIDASERAPESIFIRQLMLQWLLNRGENEAVLTRAEEAISDLGEDPVLQGTLAAAQIGVGDVDQGIRGLRAAFAAKKDSRFLARSLAQTYLAGDDLADARVVLGEYLEKKPRDTSTARLLAELELAEGQTRNAQRILARSREASGDGPDVWLIEGDLKLQEGDYSGAATLYERALEARPAISIVDRLYRTAVLGEFDNPEAVLENWIAANPEDPVVRTRLAFAYERDGRLKDAIRQYEAGLKTAPESPIFLNNLAWLYLQSGDSRALGLAESAHKLAPEAPGILDTLGWILARSGEIDRATPLLKKAAEAEPNNFAFQYHYAFVIARNGETEAAATLLQRITAAGDSFAEAANARELLDEISQ